MAYFSRLKSGKWRAQIERNGVRASASFNTKAEASSWATREEAAALSAKRGSFPRRTLAEAFDKYAEEESPKKRGERAETLRFEAFKRDYPALAGKIISEVTTPDMVAWRDARLKKVSSGSVARDLNLLSHVFTVARKEWKWCAASPITDMRRPKENPARTRRVNPHEVKRLVRWLGYQTGNVKTKQQEVALAFLLGLRTGMRAGEILSLSPANVDFRRKVAVVAHKTQHLTGRPREVPLTRQALRLLKSHRGFTITSGSLDALFRKARDALLLKDLHFHDSRAEALTRLSKKVGPFDLAKISGHKDLQILLDTYYRTSAEEIANLLR